MTSGARFVPRLLSASLAPLTAALALTACGSGEPVHEFSGSAFGTSFSVKLVAPPAELDTAGLGREIEAALDRIDRRVSTWRADSEVSRFNAYRGLHWFPVSAETCALVAEALTHSAAMAGAFDITVGPLVDLWGFGPEAPGVTPPAAADVEALLAATGFRSLHADCLRNALRKDVASVRIDLSAFAKGYAVDVLAGLLEARALADFLVEIGGEMRLSGANGRGEDWAVAIESPLPGERAVHRVLRLTDVAVATSGDYRNFFEVEGRRYSHTIDPRTGFPVAHRAAAVTVLADTAARADALATALLVMGPEAGLGFAEREGLAALFLLRDDEAIVERPSPAFSAKAGSR